MTDNDIIDKIVDILTDASPSLGLQAIYNTEKKDLSKYPCATVTPSEWVDKYLDLRDTRRYGSFVIRIYGNLEENDEETQIKVRNLKDAVIDVLEKNITLDGDIDWTEPTRGKYLFAKRAGDVYICEITLMINHRFNRTV